MARCHTETTPPPRFGSAELIDIRLHTADIRVPSRAGAG